MSQAVQGSLMFRQYLGHLEMGPWFKSSSKQLEKQGITLATPELEVQPVINYITTALVLHTWTASSKLTTMLVNVSLKFQTLISQICQYCLLHLKISVLGLKS